MKRFLHISIGEKILFLKHLAIMIRTGMPLLGALRLIQKQKKSSSFMYVLSRVIKNVENGQFLSVSLVPFKNIFGDLFINVIKIGETSGSLVDNLEHLAAELQKRKLLRQKIRAALIYPAIISVAMLIVISILMFFVMPKIMPIFSSMKIQLPITTVIVITATNFLLNNWLMIIVVLIAVIILMTLLLRIPPVKYLFHYFILYTPIAGAISRKAALSDLSRTLGLLLKSGVRIVEAVKTTSDSATNLVYKKVLEGAVDVVAKGGTLNSHFSKYGGLFPSEFSQMIEVGENTGTLESNLFYLADFYGDEVDELTKNLSSTIEPILLLIMGVAVGFVAIAIITPIYQLTRPSQ